MKLFSIVQPQRNHGAKTRSKSSFKTSVNDNCLYHNLTTKGQLGVKIACQHKESCTWKTDKYSFKIKTTLITLNAFISSVNVIEHEAKMFTVLIKVKILSSYLENTKVDVSVYLIYKNSR